MYYFALGRMVGELWAFAEITATLIATWYGLIAVWLVWGKRHWFVRAAIGGIPVAAWLLVPAYDFCWTVLVQWGVLIPLLNLERWRQRWRNPIVEVEGEPGQGERRGVGQFAISDLLLGTVVVGAICALAASTPQAVWEVWRWTLYYGVGLAVAVLIGVWAALGPGWRWARIALPVVVPYALPTAVWLLLWRRQAAPADSRPARFRRGVARGCWAVFTLAIAAYWLAVVGVLAYKSPIPEEAISAENGYPELVELGRTIAAQDQLYQFPASTNAFLDATASARIEARRAMSKPYWAPVACRSITAAEVADQRADYVQWVEHCIWLEGEEAASAGRIADALASNRDVLRLARLEASGGRTPFRRFGWERSALHSIYRLRQQMTAAQCREMIALCHEQERLGGLQERVLARNRAFCDRSEAPQDRLFGYYFKVKRSIARRFEQEEDRSSWGDYASADDPLIAMEFRLMACESGLLAYHAEHGRWPEDLNQLVPDYLPAMPVDPFTGRPLIYRLSGGSYRLYSAGYDAKDDGGADPASVPLCDAEDCDLSLDWLYRSPRPNLPTKYKSKK